MAEEQTPIEPAAAFQSTAPPQEASLNGTTTQPTDTSLTDTAMPDAPAQQAAASPLPVVQAPSPAPHRTGTPTQGSRATSAHPDLGLTIPTEAPPHGDSTRRYLNTKVTGVLLEGVKQVAKDRPEDPLRVLGEYLIQKSKELEGTR
ncbi:unnamed protein product [Clonostachys byssicola]|uniref:COMPASS component SDC1 n=1 Tax=Clonostachys byssicola TaxID=160290 RepID=A0A9N9U137_9HYPO|nr:unnamed protein product [Clonostachys byssicola]